jgi:penicillin-binding protein 2
VFEDFASHILGYVGEVSKSELKVSKFGRYEQGDMIGKNGLEKIYESNLKGKKGFKEIEVDASGRELKTLRKLSPKAGNSLILTLDSRVQNKLEKLMDEVSGKSPVEGSVVVMKVQSGEIIAMVSKPSFDPNFFATGVSRKKWNNLVRDEKNPLQNRAIPFFSRYSGGKKVWIKRRFAHHSNDFTGLNFHYNNGTFNRALP